MMQQPTSTIDARQSGADPVRMRRAVPPKVVGELPRELNGTLYRNGPNPQFEAPGAHWFVGDGMLHAFHLENGRASYRNRWIRTPKWQAEHDAGRALFGGFGRKLPDAPAIRHIRMAASPTPTSSSTPDACWRWRKAIRRPRSSPARSTAAAIATTRAASPDRSRRTPRSIRSPARWCSSAITPAGPLTPALSFGSVNASGVVTRFDRFDRPLRQHGA